MLANQINLPLLCLALSSVATFLPRFHSVQRLWDVLGNHMNPMATVLSVFQRCSISRVSNKLGDGGRGRGNE